MFKVAAGKSQLVRVAIKNAMYSVMENGYKVSVKELPHKINAEGAHVQLVTEFKVPVSIEAGSSGSEETQDKKQPNWFCSSALTSATVLKSSLLFVPSGLE